MTMTCEATIVAPVLEEATLWPVTSDSQNPGNSVSYEWKAVAYADNSTLMCSTGISKDKNKRTLRFRVKTPIFTDGVEQPNPLEGEVTIYLPTDTSVLAADLSRLLTMLQAPLGPCAFNVFRFGRFPLEQIPVKWIEAGYYDTYL